MLFFSSLAESRLSVLRRILTVRTHNTKSPTCKLWTTSSNYKSNDDSSGTISIGDVTKQLKKPDNPELVPARYLPNDEDVAHETLKHLKWIMQKDLLGQGRVYVVHTEYRHSLIYLSPLLLLTVIKLTHKT